jgi:hypothetical protein
VVVLISGRYVPATSSACNLLTDYPKCTGYNREHNRDSFSDLVRTTSQTKPHPLRKASRKKH